MQEQLIDFGNVQVTLLVGQLHTQDLFQGRCFTIYSGRDGTPALKKVAGGGGGGGGGGDRGLGQTTPTLFFLLKKHNPDTGVGVSSYMTNLSDKQAKKERNGAKGGGGVFEPLTPPPPHLCTRLLLFIYDNALKSRKDVNDNLFTSSVHKHQCYSVALEKQL